MIIELISMLQKLLAGLWLAGSMSTCKSNDDDDDDDDIY